jgi:hypothetical protein
LAAVWKVRKFAVTLTVCASGDRSMTSSRKGSGTAIVWFRNDLRISDNEALLKAWQSSQAVVPLYVVDPRLYGTTYTFGFPKTGGELMKGISLYRGMHDMLGAASAII